jgi:hypothetical protein
MLPGNILARAFTLIPPIPIGWNQATSRVTNSIGLDVTAYAATQTIQASVQPMPRTLIQFLGLDVNKDYITVYANALLSDVARDISGDQLIYNGRIWQILSNTEWQPYAGFQGTMAVNVGAA